jgi:adenylate cyclase
MNAALHNAFLREPSPPLRAACCVVAALIAVFLSLWVRMPWIRFVATVLVTAFFACLGYVFFNALSVYLPIVGPLTSLNATMLLGLVHDFTSEHLEKARLRRTLERYVSRDVVRELVDRPQEYGETLGGVVRPAAILFSDIRSYSIVTRNSTPENLVAQLNEYFTAMVECVFECGGTLDKFIGDALMAVWGTLHSDGARHDAAAAVRAALLMHYKLHQLNAIWTSRGWPELRVGIGINYGDVVVGNIGSPRRMEFTAIGDAVNQTWRLQELTKLHHTSIILSPSVAVLVADEFLVRTLGDVNARDVTEAYALCDAEWQNVPYVATAYQSGQDRISTVAAPDSPPAEKINRPAADG